MEGFKNTTKIQYFKDGGSVSAKKVVNKTISASADIAQDKALVKKGVSQHEAFLHKGEPKTELKLKTGGRAKKDCGTVKKYKTGGNVTNVYEAKKSAGDKDNIKKVKDITPVKLCGGKSVSKYATGGSTTQPGATVSQQKYYDQNRAAAKKKEAAADYEAFGSRGDAAVKGMEEGRMDALGNPYKKGGKVAKKC
jgi:hypothetical protein